MSALGFETYSDLECVLVTWETCTWRGTQVARENLLPYFSVSRKPEVRIRAVMWFSTAIASRPRPSVSNLPPPPVPQGPQVCTPVSVERSAQRSVSCWLTPDPPPPPTAKTYFTDTGHHSAKIPKMFLDFVLCSPPVLTVLLTQAISSPSPHPSGFTSFLQVSPYHTHLSLSL